MSTDPAIASGYRPYSPSSSQVYGQPVVVNFARERAQVATSHQPRGVWPNLPDRCFGVDRELPAWLIRPWQLLQDAGQRRRPLADRLADLTEVGQALDDLFAIHLPCGAEWFETPHAKGLSISEDIPRWVDELLAEATHLFLHQLRPELLAQGIYVRSVEQLDEWQ